VPGQGGRSVYALAPKGSPADDERFRKILRDTVTEIKAAENILVIKTLSGCANAAAEAIDNLSPECVVGTLAGDNTIFAAIDSKENVPAVLKLFTEAIR
jgi:transcriptional regulator of arginine metabolism